MIISNSTPLIYLAEAKQLHLLKELFKEIWITPEIKKEVVDKGKERGKEDAFLLEKEISAGWIKVKEVKKDVKIDIDIHPGEKSAISLAKERKVKTVLIDEVSARTAAKLLDLEPRGTIYVLLESVKKNLIGFDSLLSILNQFAEEGFRLHEEIYTKAIEEARRLSKRK